MYPFRTRLAAPAVVHREELLQKPEADARIRTADSFITSDDPEGTADRRSPPKPDGQAG